MQRICALRCRCLPTICALFSTTSSGSIASIRCWRYPRSSPPGVAHNYSNGNNADILLAVTAKETGLEIAYSHDLKVATHLRVEARPAGSHLLVADVYGGGSSKERRLRAGEVDLSLNAWGRGQHDYLKQWARWHSVAPWRWYIGRVWQPMKPSARRIVWMISAFEALAASLLLVIWLVVRQASA
jgi:hypothetical protein